MKPQLKPYMVEISTLEDALEYIERVGDLEHMMKLARQIRDAYWGNVITYSPKVFLPVTQLCRDVCHYCTFAKTPSQVEAPFMSIDSILDVVKQGEAMGCKEALVTLGERPELRYKAARDWLLENNYASTVDYLADVAQTILKETQCLPHINAGCLNTEEYQLLKSCSPSMGLMLESSSENLCKKGQVHYGSPDKQPAVRLKSIADAGVQKIPFTSGILIGIGETRRERIESIWMLRQLHLEYGHIQEVIIQNFKAKDNTRMAGYPEPTLIDLQWTIAMARLLLPADVAVQTPPNLNSEHLSAVMLAGINDWGGVSPVTPDFVNPEAAWPTRARLNEVCTSQDKVLHARFTIYPKYINKPAEGFTLAKSFKSTILRQMDAEGFVKEDAWVCGMSDTLPTTFKQFFDEGVYALNNTIYSGFKADSRLDQVLFKVDEGQPLNKNDVALLLRARGKDFLRVCNKANDVREQLCGDQVSYVVNRNINYTNICTYSCTFCAFSKGSKKTVGKEAAYNLSVEEVVARAVDAVNRGATEVCLQGGIHPDYTGQTYIDICSAIRAALPDIHIHAFSPLEITQGAKTLGLSIKMFLSKLKQAGLNTLPGTAAEILHDDIRDIICSDKINSNEWLHVMRTAHELGIATTATIMFGHVESIEHIAQHLVSVRDLQMETEGFTEFVPLPFVAEQAPMYLRGASRMGPSLREAILLHAVSRLTLSPWVKNIQASWVKMGEEGVQYCLKSGANDLGGVLMDESITRAAGAKHGQCRTANQMQALTSMVFRPLVQRNTAYEILSK